MLGEDYTTSGGNRFSLTLAQMINTPENFTATITTDNVLEGDHFFTVSLIEVDVGDGYIIEAGSEDVRSLSVTITDEDDGKAW